MVSRASTSYRKLLVHVQEEAELAAETARALASALEDNKKSANPATATPPSYESVVIRLARARAGKPYGGPRAALEACGAFVLEALERNAPALLASGGAAFAAELEDKVEGARGASGRVRGTGISIVDTADVKGKGKAPVAAASLVSAADPKGKGKAAVGAVVARLCLCRRRAVSFSSKASALPLPERAALREADFARQVAAKAASAEGLVHLQVGSDASVLAAANGNGNNVDRRATRRRHQGDGGSGRALRRPRRRLRRRQRRRLHRAVDDRARRRVPGPDPGPGPRGRTPATRSSCSAERPTSLMRAPTPTSSSRSTSSTSRSSTPTR